MLYHEKQDTFTSLPEIHSLLVNSILSCGDNDFAELSSSESCDDRFRKLLSVKDGIHFYSALRLFDEVSVAEFESLASEISADGGSARRNLLYYLIFFRKEPPVMMLLKRASLPASLYDDIVLTSIARSSLNSHEGNSVLEEVLDLLSQDTLLGLAVRSEILSDDKTLLLYFLSKLEPKELDHFFQDVSRVKDFITGVCRSSESFTRYFFLKNPKLHGYYGFLLHAVDVSDIPNANEICRMDFGGIEEVKKISADIPLRFDLTAEKALPLSKRNKERYAYIISRIGSFNNVRSILFGLENEGVIDSEEKSLLEEILNNPIFSDILEVYAQSSFIKNKPTHEPEYFL